MRIEEGNAVTWTVAAKLGRTVINFTGDNAEVLAREWLDRRADNGVSYRLFCTETQVTEVEHP